MAKPCISHIDPTTVREAARLAGFHRLAAADYWAKAGGKAASVPK